VPGRVLGPEGGEGGEGPWEPGCGGVGVWRGAGDPEGGQASLVSAVQDDWGEAGLAGQDGSGGGKEALCRPSLDSIPESVHAPEGSVGWNEEVGPIREYGA